MKNATPIFSAASSIINIKVNDCYELSLWLRSPNPSNCNNVRNVNTSGALNNNNANNTNGSVADFYVMARQVNKIERTCQD